MPANTNPLLVASLGLGFFLLLLTLGLPGVSGATIIVDTNGNGDYTKVQDGLDAANDGDTVRIWEGTYFERVTVNASVTITGNGTDKTIIDGSNSGNVMNVIKDSVVVEQLRITRAGSSYRALYLNEVDSIDLDHLQLDKSGYGVHAFEGSNHEYTNLNSSDNTNYGLYLYKVNYSSVDQSRFSDNRYGIYFYDNYMNEITNSNFTRNSNYAIYLNSEELTEIANCEFVDNQYGVYSQYSSQITVEDSDFYSNTYGMDVGYSDNHTLFGNYMNDSVQGIQIRYGKDHLIRTSDIRNASTYGVHLYYTENIEMRTNDLHYGSYLHIQGNTYKQWGSHDINDGNAVNWGPLIYKSGGSGHTIPSWGGQVILVGVSDTSIDGFEASKFTYGLVLAYCDNIEVLNGNYSNHKSYGIYLYYSNWTLVDENIISDNGQYGVYTYYGHNNTISNSTLDGNSRGIYNAWAHDAIYYRNQFDGNSYGIYTYYSQRTKTIENEVMNNTSYGIYHYYSNYYALRSNYLENLSYGFYIYNSDFGNVTDNEVQDPWNYGVYSYSSYWVNFDQNQVQNATRGLYIYYNNYNELTFNQVTDSSYGIYLYYSRYNELVNNTVEDNDYGFYLSSSSYENDYRNNSIARNSRYGMYDGSGYTTNDATFNWWGDKTGPYHSSKNPDGQGDNYTGNGKFDPWLGKPKPVRNLDSGETFWNLGPAIKEASADDTIRVWAGFYDENVVIDRPLTIIGNGTKNTTFKGATLGNAVTMTYTFQVLADDVTLSNLALQGNGELYVGLLALSNETILSELHLSNSIIGLLMSGDGNLLEDSNFTANTYSASSLIDLMMVEATSAVIENTLFSSRGIQLEGDLQSHFASHTFSGNTLDGRDLYYCSGQTGKTVSGDYGQVILANCDDMEIKDQNLSLVYNAMLVAYSSDVEIHDSYIGNSFTGLRVNDSSQVNIHDNLVEYVSEGGIALSMVTDSEIQSNELEFASIYLANTDTTDILTNHLNDSGIMVGDDSSEVLIENNHLYQGTPGIELDMTEDMRVFNNTIETRNGLDVLSSSYAYLLGNELSSGRGMEVADSDHITITDCYVESQYTGIDISDSDTVTITYCILTDSDRGLAVDDSTDVTIHYSDIFDNDERGLEASGSSSVVDATNNYWGDSTGPYHPQDNDQGQGDRIKENSGAQVSFEPWINYPSFNERPVAYIDSVNPSPGLIHRDITFTGHETDDETVVQWAWGSDRHGEFYNSSLWAEEVKFDDLAPGQHEIYYKVKDNYGVWSLPATTNLKIFDAPNVTSLNINPNPALDTDNIHFTGAGVDNQGANITRYRWKSSIDHQFYSGQEAEFDYDGLSVGNHTITLWVMNEYLLESNGLSTYLNINQRPLVKEMSVTPTSVTEGDEVTFEASGLDNSQVVGYIWTSDIDGEFYNGADEVIYIDTLSAGQHTISVRAVDDLGELSQPVTGNLTVAALTNKLPQLTLNFPKNNAELKGVAILRGLASDSDGTIEKVEIKIGDDDWIVANKTDSWTYKLDTTLIPNGEYELKFRAYDGEDYSQEKTVTVTVKNAKKGDDDDSPGLGLLLILGMLGACALLVPRRPS